MKKIHGWFRNVLAFLISLAFPGLGHYYKGHLGHFFTGLGLAFIVYLPFALGLFGYRFWVFALTIVLSYLVRIGLGVHAFRMSSDQKRWYHHIIFCGLICEIFFDSVIGSLLSSVRSPNVLNSSKTSSKVPEVD